MYNDSGKLASARNQRGVKRATKRDEAESDEDKERKRRQRLRVSSLRDPMRTDLVTTRSLPFGFRSVNRKLQPRLVCNEHNGDGSRVKVGQLERGKRASERRRSDKKRRGVTLRSRARFSFFPSAKNKGRNEPFGRNGSRKREK